jgi:hypothetical protein
MLPLPLNSQIRGLRIAMKTIIRFAIIAAGLALGSMFGVATAYVSVDAP